MAGVKRDFGHLCSIHIRFLVVLLFISNSLNPAIAQNTQSQGETAASGEKPAGTSGGVLNVHSASPQRRQLPEGEKEKGGPLNLTKYIKEGNIDDARNMSRVKKLFENNTDIEAHSGYMTVREGTNYFFLFLKNTTTTRTQEGQTKKRPLVLWLFGGPGISALMACFLYNGPIEIDKDGNLRNRTHTLLEEADIIYLDQPDCSGFSYNDNWASCATNTTMEIMSENIINFLDQFLEMFKEYSMRRFYISGESYAARNAMHLAFTMSKANTGASRKIVSLSLDGVITGVPVLGPVLRMLDPTEFLFQVGMLNTKGKKQFQERFHQIETLFNATNYTDALMLLSSTILNSEYNPYPSLFTNLTGHWFDASVLYSGMPNTIGQFYKVLNETWIKQDLHVNTSATVDEYRQYVVVSIAPSDFGRDYKDEVGDVLNKTRALLYSSGMDTVVSPANIMEHFLTVNHSSISEFNKTNRIFKYTEDNSTLVSYTSQLEHLTYVLIAQAGHYVSLDAPMIVYDIIMEFIRSSTAPNCR